VFGLGHIITKSGAMDYVTQCNPVEVVPRVNSNCMEDIPARWNSTTLFLDLISCVIKSAASST
jgi:hypothetical protein